MSEKMQCGACARVGTNDVRPMAHSPGCTAGRYCSVVIPYVPAAYRTPMHPTESEGPFAVLSRGAFQSEGAAIEWARANLGGAPYSIRWVEP